MIRLFLLLAFLLFSQTVNAEIIKLKSGEIIKAKILVKNDKEITVETGVPETGTYPLDLIDKIEETPLQEGQKIYERINNKGELELEIIANKETNTNDMKVYSDDGKVISEGSYKNGQMEGIHRVYYPNGKLMHEMEFKNGVLLHFKQYDKNGGIIKDNKFDEKGNPIKE